LGEKDERPAGCARRRRRCVSCSSDFNELRRMCPPESRRCRCSAASCRRCRLHGDSPGASMQATALAPVCSSTVRMALACGADDVELAARSQRCRDTFARAVSTAVSAAALAAAQHVRISVATGLRRRFQTAPVASNMLNRLWCSQQVSPGVWTKDAMQGRTDRAFCCSNATGSELAAIRAKRMAQLQGGGGGMPAGMMGEHCNLLSCCCALEPLLLRSRAGSETP